MALLNALNIGAAAFYVYLFIVIQKMKVRTRQHKILAFASIALFQWTITAYFVYNAQNIEVLRLLLPISCIGLFLFFPLNFHFAYSVAYKRPMPKLFLLLLYAAGLFFTVMQFFIPVSMMVFTGEDGGLVVTQAIGTRVNTVWAVYAVACWMVPVGFYFRYYRKTALNREKKQASLLIYMILGTIVLLLSEYYLPFFIPEWKIPSHTPLLLTPWAGAMVYAIWRYGFLRISPGHLVEKILDSVEDLVLLYSMDGTIVYRNQKAVRVLGESLAGRSENAQTVNNMVRLLLNDKVSWAVDYPEKQFMLNVPSTESTADNAPPPLISPKDVKEDPPLQKSSLERERQTDAVPISASDPSGNVPRRWKEKARGCAVDVRVKPLLDRFGDPLGVLVSGTIVTRFDTFLDKYKLTRREAEIIEYLMTGRTVGEIARLLHITGRTVKTHITNIYWKTGVSNRVELVIMIMRECK
jgi:DNA-binding CsgD family transcriptional regulator/PAS domain-containing protein